MPDLNWRTWMYGKLAGHAPLTSVVPVAQIKGAGSLDSDPGPRPFIVIRIGTERRGPFPGVSYCDAMLWVHDEPGDYLRIDNILQIVKDFLVPNGREEPVPNAGGIAITWQGHSSELADEGFRTIMRNASYQLTGKAGAG